MRYTFPEPSPNNIRDSISKTTTWLEKEIGKLNTRLEIHRKALECQHDDLDTITEEDYDGHRTDYTTYWYCTKCGWCQDGKWVEPEPTTKDK